MSRLKGLLYPYLVKNNVYENPYVTKNFEEHGPDQSQSAVYVGNNTPVSMQMVQDLYNEIHGEKRTITKAITSSHTASFEDIKQLNNKIVQLYEQYNIQSKNCSIVLYHTDDCKAQFSSFDRFEIYDRSNLNPTENIRITYNFLIILPHTRRAQTYTITIDLHSRAAIQQRAEKEHGLPKKVLKIFSRQTGNIEISYIDYTVARNFLTTIEEWEKGLEKSRSSKFLEISQQLSEHFPFFFRAITTFAIAAALFFNSGDLLPVDIDLYSIFPLAIASFSAIFLGSQISFKLGQLAQDYTEEYQTASSLMLSRGDEIAYEKQKRGNKKSVIKYSLSILTALAVNIFSVWLTTKIGLPA